MGSSVMNLLLRDDRPHKEVPERTCVDDLSNVDFVADARGWSAVERATNRFDMLRRDLLRMPIGGLELEWREHPVSLATRLVLANMKVCTWLLLTFCVSTLMLGPVLRTFGGGLLSAWTYPIICFCCAIRAYSVFGATASLSDAGKAFIIPQAVAIFLEWAFSPAISNYWRTIPLIVCACAVAFVADQVNTHYVRWITANLQLKQSAVTERRRTWDSRFNWKRLSLDIRLHRYDVTRLERCGEKEEAAVFRRKIGELREIREYALGFLIIPYLIILHALGASTTTLAWTGILLSCVSAFRRPLVTFKLARLISEVVVRAFVSWLSWDTAQQWVKSPGMFKDRLYSPLTRVAQTAGCFFLVQVALIGPIGNWGTGLRGSPIWLWRIDYDFFLNLLFPALLLICTLVSTGARPLWIYLEAIEWAEASEELEEGGIWDALVGRLLKSSNRLEREYVFLGWHAEYGYPVLVPKWCLQEHMQIQGGTGSGKSSRGFAPLQTQLIRAGTSAVIIFDFKGEPLLRETARIEAEMAGRVFKHFTNVFGLSSFLFNPFQQSDSSRISFSQKVETLMEALRMNYGDGYGKKFFTSQARAWLLKTFKRFPNIASFEELHAKAAPEFFKNETERDRCLEAITIIQQLAEVTAMNWKPGPGESDQPLQDAIFMPDVVAQGQVIYCSLPAIGETSTVKEIGNLLLYAVMNAVKEYRERGGKNQTYVFIDEAQQMASRALNLILNQGRGFGMSLILGNQSDSALMSPEMNRLLDTIRANTQVKLYFSVTDANTVKLLEKASGVIPYETDDGKFDYRPRLTANDIAEYSSREDLAICWITRNAGFAAYGGNWFAIRTAHHISRDEFERRSDAPWPAATASTIVAERTVDGATAFTQGRSETSPAPEAEELPLRVARDSAWAIRLNELYESKFNALERAL
jgi:hypothetical protein